LGWKLRETESPVNHHFYYKGERAEKSKAPGCAPVLYCGRKENAPLPFGFAGPKNGQTNRRTTRSRANQKHPPGLRRNHTCPSEKNTSHGDV
jgi:hypothetical protein